MRLTLSIAVLLAVVSTAMVAVCEHTEVCRLRYRLWEVERRRDLLERQIRELDAALAENETPAQLLGAPAAAAVGTPTQDLRPTQTREPTSRAPSGEPLGRGNDLRWYEGGGR